MNLAPDLWMTLKIGRWTMKTRFRKEFFQKTQIVGDIFRLERESLGLTIRDVARKCGFHEKYIRYLENGFYQRLPGGVYTENFIKKYSRILGFDVALMLSNYREEVKFFKRNDVLPQAKFRDIRFVITPPLIRKIVLFFLSIVGLAYLGFQIYKIFLPPELIVDYPPNQLVLMTNEVEIRGKTELETKVMINYQEIFIDPQGKFYEVVPLEQGVNIIEIRATRKHSRPNIVQREILVKKSE